MTFLVNRLLVFGVCVTLSFRVAQAYDTSALFLDSTRLAITPSVRAPRFLVGVRAGMLVPAMIPKGADPFTNQEIRIKEYTYAYGATPFYGGFFVAYPIQKNMRVQAGFTLSDNSLRVKKDVTYAGLVEEPTRIELKMPELLFDVVYQYGFLDERLWVLGGAYVSSLFQSELTTYTPLRFLEVGLDVTATQKATMSKVDAGLVLGASYFLGKHFFVEARIHFGLVDMIQDNTLLKITSESLSVVEPAVAKATYDAIGTSFYPTISRLTTLSNEYGKKLVGVDIYRMFVHGGVGWVF